MTKIGDYAFFYCDVLTSITIPSGVTYIDWGAFYGWTDAQTIYIQTHSSAPASWNSNWNYNCSATIVWGVA